MTDFETYQSPFTWRYGSPEMRAIWSEAGKRRLWRKLWVAMAEAQIPFGLVTYEQADDLAAHSEDIDVSRALEIEKEIHHDLMAEIRVFAAQCPTGGPILHLGATSMDIKDNTEALQMRDSLDLILTRLANLLKVFQKKISSYAGLPVMAYTHLQPAEPTTLGYRLASYAQDFLDDHEDLLRIKQNIKGKGFKGAVGNAAANVELLGEQGQLDFEQRLSQELDLPFFQVSTQTYSRRQDLVVLSALSTLAASAHKLAFDLRLLQSEMIGELAESFGRQQVGSSAMPFKRNPVEAEKVDSLARLVGSMPQTAWENHANSLLERTLDDSANRRLILPQSFLAVDEILTSLTRIMDGLVVNRAAIERNLKKFSPFSALERVLVEAVKRGADRQATHEALRQISMQAWEVVQEGAANPLMNLLAADHRINGWIPQSDLAELFDTFSYTGNAETGARALAARIRDRLPE
jgi:adenylosuccinate lyase